LLINLFILHSLFYFKPGLPYSISGGVWGSMKKAEKLEYNSLKNKYYSLKDKVIENISRGYCIIPEKTLLDLRDKYETKLLELLKSNTELAAKDKLKKEYDGVAQKYYINNISKEFKEQSKKEIDDLEQMLSIYEATFDNSQLKEGLLKVIGKTKISKAITGVQLISMALCFFDPESIPRNVLEVLLMQYSKYEIDKHLYKRKKVQISDEQKISALKEGIEYLDKYFDRKGIKILA